MNLKTTLILVLAITADIFAARVLTHVSAPESGQKRERKLLSFTSTAVKQAAYEKLMCKLISPKEAQ